MTQEAFPIDVDQLLGQGETTAESASGPEAGRAGNNVTTPIGGEGFVFVGSPPVITNFSPAPGTQLGRFQEVGFDLTDPDGDLQRGEVQVAMGGLRVVVHDGDIFAEGFTGTRTPIGSGFRFSVKADAGWLPGNDKDNPGPRFFFNVTDAAGNEAI